MRILVAAGLVAVGLSLPAPPSYAAATCQGLPTTIEATGGGTVSGTPGDDVISVSGQALRVEAGAGNDTICVLADTLPVQVDAGGGDDRVSAAGSSYPVEVQLGTGTDAVVGDGEQDYVESSLDGLRDTISTGGGSDRAVLGAPALLDTGEGPDTVVLVGTGHAGSEIDLGTGRDTVEVHATRSVRVDLDTRQVTVDGATSSLRRAEDVFAVGRRIVVRGDGDDNLVSAWGCRLRLTGDRGDDMLQMANPTDVGLTDCPRYRAVILGGTGDDELTGQRGDDRLIGGPGRDRAFGGSGRDHCAAERTTACES